MRDKTNMICAKGSKGKVAADALRSDPLGSQVLPTEDDNLLYVRQSNQSPTPQRA